MAYRFIFILPDGERYRDAQVFATPQEARGSAAIMAWTMPTGWDPAISTEETEDEVNCRYDTETGDVALGGGL